MSGAVDGVLLMRFGRWADANPAAARCVNTIMATFRVARRTAFRLRKQHRESLKHAAVTVHPRTGRHDLQLDHDDLDRGTSEYVAASLRHATTRSR